MRTPADVGVRVHKGFDIKGEKLGSHFLRDHTLYDLLCRVIIVTPSLQHVHENLPEAPTCNTHTVDRICSVSLPSLSCLPSIYRSNKGNFNLIASTAVSQPSHTCIEWARMHLFYHTQTALVSLARNLHIPLNGCCYRLTLSSSPCRRICFTTLKEKYHWIHRCL